MAGDLTDWSRNVLGDLEKRIKKVKKELEACRRLAKPGGEGGDTPFQARKIGESGGYILETASPCEVVAGGRSQHFSLSCCLQGEEEEE